MGGDRVREAASSSTDAAIPHLVLDDNTTRGACIVSLFSDSTLAAATKSDLVVMIWNISIGPFVDSIRQQIYSDSELTCAAFLRVDSILL